MRALALFCVIGIGVEVAWPARPIAAGKTPNPGVIVTFGDREGDAIFSDGHGDYVNGTGGVVGQILTTGPAT